MAATNPMHSLAHDMQSPLTQHFRHNTRTAKRHSWKRSGGDMHTHAHTHTRTHTQRQRPRIQTCTPRRDSQWVSVIPPVRPPARLPACLLACLPA
mmetsp:Transcript_24549/g.70866  ORF Transcript_24549/g.70866 Transcript_24549/m.70866 type:complete len:95 (-) Transcript_24549:231-515(-)